MELELTQEQRLRLKARSHHLEPTVLLGAHGLTDAVLKEIDRALTAHELIKVRMPALEREERERLAAQMAERLGAARIQLIGRLAVLFRPAPEEPKPRHLTPGPSAASGRAQRSGSRRAGPRRRQT